jgi:hypothetical protein
MTSKTNADLHEVMEKMSEIATTINTVWLVVSTYDDNDYRHEDETMADMERRSNPLSGCVPILERAAADLHALVEILAN